VLKEQGSRHKALLIVHLSSAVVNDPAPASASIAAAESAPSADAIHSEREAVRFVACHRDDECWAGFDLRERGFRTRGERGRSRRELPTETGYVSWDAIERKGQSKTTPE
jgi:hypothetical protein